MKLLKQISFDWKQGIMIRWKLYLVVIAVSAVMTAFFYASIKKYTFNVPVGEISFIDALLYMFRGMKEYQPEFREAFDVSEAYLIWNILLAVIIGDYPTKELASTGKIHLIRMRKRRIWWCGKCVWNMLAVFVFYGCIYLGILIGTLYGGGNILSVNENLFFRTFSMNLTGQSTKNVILQVLLLPVFSSMAISFLQMVVSISSNDILGYICTMIVCGLSAYYMKWFMPGNGSMVHRFAVVNPDGIGLVKPMSAYLLIMIASFLAGCYYFENKDIL